MSEHGEHSPDDRDAEDAADRIKRAFAARLHEEKMRSGVSLRRLSKLTAPASGNGRGYPVTTIADKINGRTAVDREFMERFLQACYRARGREADLDLDEWREEFAEKERQLARLRRGEPEWPHKVGLVPRKASAFQLRGPAQMARDLLRGNATVVISGLDGVGKSQVAVGLAQAMWHAGELDVMIWVTATSRASIVAGYAEAARVMRVGGDADAAMAADRLLAALGEPNGWRWLVVLDDLTDPDEVRGLWPPAAAQGRTIVTTNRQDAAMEGEDRHFLHLGPFDPEESLRYLHDRIRFRPADRRAAELLAADLGHLPAALAQATAYMKDRHLDCGAYRDRLRLLPLADMAPEALPDDHAEPLARVWGLSVARADELSPPGLARPVLELAAQLDHNGIPIELFTSAPAIQQLAGRRGRPTTPGDVADALHCLHRLSLIDFDTSFSRVWVNRVLQRAVRESMQDGNDAVVAAADALLSRWPDADQGVELVRVLRANAFAMLDHAAGELWDGRLHQVFFRAGNSLTVDGLLAEAIDFWERRLLPVASDRLGPDHPDTLTVGNNLAWAHGRAGDPRRALRELRELLPARERALGETDDNTMATKHGIAFWAYESGDVSGAVAAMEDVLADYLTVLGPTHRDTLNTRLSLALWLGESQGPEAAVARLRDLADDHLHALGADRPETLDVRYHLAEWLGRARRYPEALEMAGLLCADSAAALGAEHPDTLIARRLSALLHRDADDEARASAELGRLHADLVRVHGADHPYALAVAEDLDRSSA